MSETTIPTSQLHPGDRIANWCGILVDVSVSEIAGGLVRFTRADGTSFTTSFPPDATILVRVPRLVKAVA
jgi:hypothetical protein